MGWNWLKSFVFVSNIAHCAVTLFLPYLLRGEPDYFLQKPEHNKLRIVMSGVNLTSYNMIIEKKCVFQFGVEIVTMCKCVDFVPAFAVMIALHYLFNVTNTKKTETTMICVQRLSLEIQRYHPKCFHWFEK